jgi:amino acid adenylation domain-containing protein
MMDGSKPARAVLGKQHLERILRAVSGGSENLQDAYPLSPLQEGILFHRLLNERSDTYVLSTLFELESATHLAMLCRAVQTVLNRHDVLRTSILWEGLPHPVQVVHRHATLPVEERLLERARDPMEQLKAEMRSQARLFDLRQAPLVRLVAMTGEAVEKCYALLQVHHIVCDHQSLRMLAAEVMAVIEGREDTLPPPQPYRSYVEQALEGADAPDETYFRTKLGGIDEPTAPFGLLNVHADCGQIDELSYAIDGRLARAVRQQARRAGLSAARLFHAAWALVVARTSGRDDIVFGTVILASSRRADRSARMIGMFVNTLPLRVQLSDLTARQLVDRTSQELVQLLEHERASLALAQRCSAVASSEPLFTTLFNYRHAVPESTDRSNAAGIRVLCRGEAWSSYPIAVTVDDLGDDFAFTIQVDRTVSARRIARYLETALHSLVQALDREPDQRALALSILPEEERQLLEFFNDTDRPFPRERSIHAVFEQRVLEAPGSPAVCNGSQVLSFAELNSRANQLAWHLRRCGVVLGEYVCVLMERSAEMLVAQLAILKSGGIYMPVDPQTPPERRMFMMRDCGVRFVLVTGTAPADLHEGSSVCIDCSMLTDAFAREPSTNLDVAVDGEAAAYIMYTSGSTGTPKGVVVSHRAVNRLAVNNGYAEIGPGDCIAHHSNPIFDAATFEVWTALLNGARVVIVPQPVVLDGPRFAELLNEQRVTALYMSVGLFNQYTTTLAAAFGRLRYLLIGGEALEPGAVRRVLNHSPPQQLLNVYGPTECTTFATKYVVREVADDACRIPIGSPIANTRIYITDGHLQLAPIGAIGEIHIGGAGVARGYLNRQELTAERFVPDPFSGEHGARIYRTGDLGRWNEDGTIDYLGRNDRQLKIRGYRIEPREVEAQLLRDPRVENAVVIAREDLPGDKRLVAYLVATDVCSAPTIDEVRESLAASLPDYMVPSAFVMLQQLPLNSSGKLDRRALPAPSLAAYATCEYVAPEGQAEEMLASIWRDVLRVECVGRNHDFFQIGGNSLIAMRLIVAVADAFRVPLSTQLVFKHPTLVAMARAVEALIAERPPEMPALSDVDLEFGVL